MAHKEEIKRKSREYHAAHKEECNRKSREYWAAHKEEQNRKQREHLATHKEKAKLIHQKYYAAHKEESNRKSREYRAAHLDELKLKNQAYRAAHGEKYKRYLREYHAVHKEEQNLKAREKKQDLRKRFFDIYGRTCSCPCGCKESRIGFLSIGHPMNDGKADRAQKGGYIGALKRAVDHPDHQKYSTLCINCNNAANHNNGVCPGIKSS